MLAHLHRLRSKDVRFLTKKRQYFTKGQFGFFYVKQYPNREFNQFSFHVSIKYSKHATKRNKLKRQVMNWLRDNSKIHQKIAGNYRKVFIVLNKNLLESMITQDQNVQISNFQTSFTSFFTFL